MSERRGERDRGPFAEWVRERRTALGLSIRDFAERGDMPENWVSAVESGRVRIPRKYLSNLAVALGVSEMEVAARATGVDQDEPQPSDEDDPVVTALLWELRELDDAGKKMVLDQVRAARRWQKEFTGQD